MEMASSGSLVRAHTHTQRPRAGRLPEACESVWGIGYRIVSHLCLGYRHVYRLHCTHRPRSGGEQSVPSEARRAYASRQRTSTTAAELSSECPTQRHVAQHARATVEQLLRARRASFLDIKVFQFMLDDRYTQRSRARLGSEPRRLARSECMAHACHALESC
jgi:hypothetical protein